MLPKKILCFAAVLLALTSKISYGMQDTPVVVCWASVATVPYTDFFSLVFNSGNGLAVHIYEDSFNKWILRNYSGIAGVRTNTNCTPFNSADTAARQRQDWIDLANRGGHQVHPTRWPEVQ